MRCALVFLAGLVSFSCSQAQGVELSAAQRSWIAAHRDVRIAPRADLAPLDSIDADARERGLAGDYLKLIAARTGLSFRIVGVTDRRDPQRSLREHRVDLLPGVFLPSTVQPAQLFSAPYLRLSGAIYARSDDPGFGKIAQLDGHKVSIAAGTTWGSILLAAGSTATVQELESTHAALSAMLDKRSDAYVGDPFSTAKAIADAKFDDRAVLSGQLGLEAPFGMQVRSDWPQLRDILDVALKNISVDEEKALRERWLSSAQQVNTQTVDAIGSLPVSQSAAIDAALSKLATARDVPAVERKQREEFLHQAQDDEARGDAFADQLQRLTVIATDADASAQKLVDTLAVDDTAAMLAWRAALPERATVEQLDTLLNRERDAQAAAVASAAATQAELDRQTQRPTEIRNELIAAQAVLEKNSIQAKAPSATPLSQAQALRAQSANRAATIQIALLNIENRSYEPRMRLLSAQSRDQQRLVSEIGQHVSALENLVLQRTGVAATDLQDRVQKQHDEIDAHLRLLTDAANTNVDLVARLIAVVHGLGDIRQQKQGWDDTLRDTIQALKNTEERIRIGGVSEAVGLILLAEKSKLKPLPVLRRSLASIQTDLAQTRMSLIDLREQQSELDDLGAAVTKAMARLQDVPPERLNELRTGLYKLLNTRAAILPQLMLQQTRLVNAQRDAEQTLGALVDTTEQLDKILNTRLLWTPSHAPVAAAWLLRIGESIPVFLAPMRWVHVARNAAIALRDAPFSGGAGLLCVLALFLLRRRAPQRLEQLTLPMRRIRTDRYRLTGEALLWTIFAAAPLPALLFVVGKLCRLPPSSVGGFTETIGYALIDLAGAVFAISFLRALTAEKGLAQYHFRWPRQRRESLLSSVPWIALIVVPTMFLLEVMQLRNDDASTESLGRLLLSIALLGFGALLWRVFAPNTLWTTRNLILQEPLRLRQATRFALCAASALLAVLVLRGYFVTAFALSGRVLQTLCVILVVTTVHGMAVRWLVLGERRLALKRMEQKQETSDEQRERAEGSEGERLPEPEAEQITIASVSAQTRRILRALTLVALVGSLLWVWSDVTPAVAFLNDVPVWRSQHLSLLNLLEALIVLSLTWIATRNMPGLIEIGVLRRFHMDAPTRYAITSVTRYIIVFAGSILGLSMLGLRWSNLQWLAAGFSVGLGFGMQEIFANFISGLMVLFERPFRVGDIITIGTVEGTVSRIRTRATTIVDWDNKEVIVPNKSFITDRLVNWTLSDSITRVVIKVGVAYRNSPAQAQQLLLEVAKAHAQVLNEPAPTCWMMGFGDSTQDFELRVYVAEIGQRNPVKTELQIRIADVFRSNDIEIAFPQLDVRLLQTDAPSANATIDSKRA